MNQFDAIVADLEATWPGWKAWYVPKAVGGMIWCARRAARRILAARDRQRHDAAGAVQASPAVAARGGCPGHASRPGPGVQ